MKKLLVILLVVLLAGCDISIIPAVSEGPAAPPTQSALSGASVSPSPAATPTPSPTTAPTAMPTITPTPAPTETPVPLPVITEQQDNSENDDIEIALKYPVISGMQDESFQDEVNMYIHAALMEFSAEKALEAAADTMKPGKYYVYSSFSVERNDGYFISIPVSVEYYAGGANIGMFMIILNGTNAAPGQWIMLEDLFAPGADYISAINGEIQTQIAADPDSSSYTFSTVYFDSKFYLTETELVMVFEAYDIAPGAYGMPEFAIPLSEFSGMLADELE